MMLRRFRARAWCLVMALCLAAGTTAASFDALLHNDAGHDAACVPAIAVAHDASAHQVQDAGSNSDHSGSHCLACHWARSFRTDGVVVQFAAHAADTGGHHVVEYSLVALAPELAHRAPRAPPIALQS
jgi:hypothetical protein